MTRGSVIRIAGAGVAALLAASAGCTSSSNAGPASALGESCARTADCQTGLACVANVCSQGRGNPVSGPTGGDAGPVEASGPAPSLPGTARVGETCQTTQDCAAGLDCVPSSGGSGVCDIVSYGVAPTGKACTGECGAPSDCCAYPSGLSISGVVDGGIFVSVNNCQDIVTLMLGGDPSVCAGSPPPGSLATACFYYQTFCQCAPDTWACPASKCVYAAKCQVNSANTLGGCPSFTRSRAALNSTCNVPSGKCQNAASTCATDTDCNGSPVADEQNITCRSGDCACSASACYLKCAKDLDCPAGYSCATSSKLCEPSPCSNDAECFSRLGKARAKCNQGVCGIPCTVDHDCSPSGDVAGAAFNGTVCGDAGVCAPVGCAADSDCTTATGPRVFCVTPSATAVRSALSN